LVPRKQVDYRIECGRCVILEYRWFHSVSRSRRIRVVGLCRGQPLR
jgi:hypothetical protein